MDHIARAQELLLSADAHNAPPEQRLEVITTLFTLGREAVDAGELAVALMIADQTKERLMSHLYMARVVERE